MNRKPFTGAPYSRDQFRNVPLAGHIFSYESCGARISFEECRKLAAVAGFDSSLAASLMPDISPEQAWRRARKKFAGMRQGFKVDITAAGRTTDYLKHQVTFKDVDETEGAEKVGFEESFMCIFYRKEQKLVFDGIGVSDRRKAVATRLQLLHEELSRNINTSTVRHFCQKVAERFWSPVPIRRRGGVWFALNSFTPQMEKMEVFFSSLGGHYAFYMVPIVDMESERHKISRWVEYGMATDMSALQSEFQKRCEEVRDQRAGGQTDSIISGRAAKGVVHRAQEFVKKVGVYETALNYRADELRGKAATVEDMVRKALSGAVDGVMVEGGAVPKPYVPPKRAKVDLAKEVAAVLDLDDDDDDEAAA